MSAETINLRQARKRRAREEAEAKAAANRAKFGERKAPRDQRQAEAERSQRGLDAQKLTKPPAE
jgi:hypothetical protein